MLYFDDLKAIMELSDEECGKFLRAVFNYGMHGEVPDFTGTLKVAWAFIQPKQDRDNERYIEKCRSAKYSNYCGQCSRKNIVPLSRDEWETLDDTEVLRWLANANERSRTTTDVHERLPTITTTPTTDPTGTTDPTTATTPTPSSERTGAVFGKGEGVGEEKPLPIIKTMPSPSYSPLNDEEFEERKRMCLEMIP